MSVLKGLKKQFKFDLMFVVFLVAAVLVYVWASGLRLPGWDVKGKDVVLNENKTETRNIYIRDGGVLSIEGAELVLQDSNSDSRGVYLEGNANLKLKRSSIIAEDGVFILSLSQKGNDSPTVKIADSSFVNSDGIYMFGNSFLQASNSDIGTVYMRESSRAELTNTDVSFSLTANKSDIFENLVPGTDVSRQLKSKLGWNVKLDSCEVGSYQVEVYDDDEMTINSSSDVRLLFQTPGKLEKSFELDGNSLSSLSGELLTDWFLLKWNNTTFSSVNLIAKGTDEVSFRNARIGTVASFGSSKITLESSTINCHSCKVGETAVLTLEGVSVENNGNQNGKIIVVGLGKLNIKNSDIRGIEIVVEAGGDLIIENSQFDENDINFRSDGVFTVDGVSRNDES